MKITYDRLARAAFIYVSDAPIRQTREITETVLIDLDDDGNVVGVELLDVDAPTVEDITTPLTPPAEPAGPAQHRS